MAEQGTQRTTTASPSAAPVPLVAVEARAPAAPTAEELALARRRQWRGSAGLFIAGLFVLALGSFIALRSPEDTPPPGASTDVVEEDAPVHEAVVPPTAPWFLLRAAYAPPEDMRDPLWGPERLLRESGAARAVVLFVPLGCTACTSEIEAAAESRLPLLVVGVGTSPGREEATAAFVAAAVDAAPRAIVLLDVASDVAALYGAAQFESVFVVDSEQKIRLSTQGRELVYDALAHL